MITLNGKPAFFVDKLLVLVRCAAAGLQDNLQRDKHKPSQRRYSERHNHDMNYLAEHTGVQEQFGQVQKHVGYALLEHQCGCISSMPVNQQLLASLTTALWMAQGALNIRYCTLSADWSASLIKAKRNNAVRWR